MSAFLPLSSLKKIRQQTVAPKSVLWPQKLVQKIQLDDRIAEIHNLEKKVELGDVSSPERGLQRTSGLVLGLLLVELVHGLHVLFGFDDVLLRVILQESIRTLLHGQFGGRYERLNSQT